MRDDTLTDLFYVMTKTRLWLIKGLNLMSLHLVPHFVSRLCVAKWTLTHTNQTNDVRFSLSTIAGENRALVMLEVIKKCKTHNKDTQRKRECTEILTFSPVFWSTKTTCKCRMQHKEQCRTTATVEGGGHKQALNRGQSHTLSCYSLI